MAGYLELPGSSGEGASTPDHASLDITGDLQIILCAAFDTPTGSLAETLISKGDPGASIGSWRLRRTSSARNLQFTWRESGGTIRNVSDDTGVLIPATAGQVRWYKLTFDADTATGTYYYSDDSVDTPPDSVSWTLDDTDSRAVASNINSGSAAVWLGNRSDNAEYLNGRIYYAEIRSGIGGTVVANPDFRTTAQRDSATQLTDDQGKVWTVVSPASWDNVAPAEYNETLRQVSVAATISGTDIYNPAGGGQQYIETGRQVTIAATISRTDVYYAAASLAHGSSVEGTFTTEDPITLQFTPAGTPRAIVAFLTQTGSSVDPEVSPPTYGGQVMTRVNTAFDPTGQPGRVIVWLLAANVPVGTQTFSLDVSVTTGVKHVVLASVNSSVAVEVADTAHGDENQVDPQVALNSGVDTALRYVVLYGGGDGLAEYTALAGQTLVHDHNFIWGANEKQVSIVTRQTTPGPGSATIGWTAGSQDAALVGVALRQVQTAAAPNYVDLPGAPTDFISTPDHADFDITTDLSLRILARVDAAQLRWQNLITKGSPGSTDGSYLLRVGVNLPYLQLQWRTSAGVVRTADSGDGIVAFGSDRWYRADLDLDNAGQWQVKFYYSDDPVGTAVGSVTWTLFSTINGTDGATSLAAGTAPVYIGSRSDLALHGLDGRVYWAGFYSGAAFTLEAAVDFRDADEKTGPEQFTDPQAHVWTISGNAAWVSEGGTGGTTVTLPWHPLDFVTYWHRGSESIDFIIEFPTWDFVVDGTGHEVTVTAGSITLPWYPLDFVFDADRWYSVTEAVPEPPPAPLPSPVVTIAEILASPLLEIAAGLELLDASDRVIADITADLESGSVERNLDAAIHGLARFRMARAINWHNQRLRPYLTITELVTGASQRWDLGIYLPETPQRRTGESVFTYEVEAYDKLVMLVHPHGIAHTVHAGDGIVTEVEAILDNLGLTHSIVHASAAVAASDTSWPLDAENTTLRILNDLLGSIGYRGLYVDRSGAFRSEPYRPPSQQAPVWHYNTADERTLVGAVMIEEVDLFAVPNRWVFVRDDPALGPPSEGDGIYTVVNNSDGPTSIAQRGRTISRVELLHAPDQASLIAQGDRLVQEDRQPVGHLEFTSVPNPSHWHADAVTVTAAELGLTGAVFGEVFWSLPLDGGDMTHRVRRTVNV